MSDIPALPDVDALAEALCANRRPGRGPCAAHRVTAEAVLAVLPPLDVRVRALADAARDVLVDNPNLCDHPETCDCSAARLTRAVAALTPKGTSR